MVIAVLSLCGVFIATYLTLYKLGYLGTIACGTGGCETVQMSRWSVFLGLPVSVWGVGFYVAMFVIATAGSFGTLVASRAVSVAMVAMTGWGVLFSGWLTWLELARINAICRYCVVSAVLVVVLFAISVADWRAMRTAAATVG
jgi:uncharacterized membrane protein